MTFSRLLCGALVPLALLLPLHAEADCLLDAARYHHVNPTILLAIAVVESKMHPDASHLNVNGSTDMGLMQINSVHLSELAKYGVKREDEHATGNS